MLNYASNQSQYTKKEREKELLENVVLHYIHYS